MAEKLTGEDKASARTFGGANVQGIQAKERTETRAKSADKYPWDAYYAAAALYFEHEHNLTPPADYVTADGVRLGAWLVQLRTARQIGLKSSYLTPEHIAQLDAIGMVWDAYDFVFERNYRSAADYYRAHGDLECDPGYVDRQGIRLGAWLAYLRRQFKIRGRSMLTDEQFRMLDAIGMRWGSKYDKQWDMYYQVLSVYVHRTGNTDVPISWREEGVQLGRWFRRQKEMFAAGTLHKERADMLRSLGLELTMEDPWERKFRLAKAYSETHDGSLECPNDYVVQGVSLRKWLNRQLAAARKGILSMEKTEKLRSIGADLTPQAAR